MARAVPALAITAAVASATAIGLLVTGSPAARASAGHPARPGAAAPGRAGDGLSVFRVDVSRYPRIGLVVTVPGAPGTLAPGDFSVSAAGRHAVPDVRRLSPADVELAVAPATGLPPAGLAAEQAAAARFLASLPAGERSVAVDPATPGTLPGALSADPAPAVAAIAALHRGTTAGGPAPALETALSAFTAGPRVRRTVVLAVTAGQPPPAALASRLRAWLAASGTSLYVLDAVPGAAASWDALATGSGGRAIPVPGPGAWGGAFARVSADLGEQYYLRFTDQAPLPGRARVTVTAAGRELAGIASLPAANPVLPRVPVPSPAPRHAAAAPASAYLDLTLGLLATALIITGISYGMAMLAASRRDPRPGGQRALRAPRPPGGALARAPGAGALAPRPDLDGLFFVFLMPCLNEEAVIANSLRRLLSMADAEFAVLVIDDGSDDGTAGVVAGMADERVLLLRREPPQARQGKGQALNAAISYLLASGHLNGRDASRVIAVVVDADGRLDPGSLQAVAGCFADPAVGAVQIGVRINNRVTSTLARMQDMEFVIYTEVFQRGRRHLGSVGLGGNGQFMRLSALLSLGPAPWSYSLADDLDLGVRMIAAGWRNEYCPSVAVHQQGVVELGRLIRQRTRWFQGHLQTWRLIPLVLRHAPRRSRADLLYHLTSPALLLVASLLTASFLASAANAAIEAARGLNPAGWWIASTYALTFGPALAFSAIYWERERREGVGLLRAIWLAHLYVGYGMMWYAAGWRAIVRTLRGQTSWAKTARVAEAADAAVPAPAQADAAAVPGPAAHREAAARPGQRATLSARAVPPAAPLAPAWRAAHEAPAPGGPDRGGPGRRRERQGQRRRWWQRRRRVAALAAAAAITCAAAVTAAVAGGGSPTGWDTVFTGYGRVSVAGAGPGVTVSLDPAAAASRTSSHAALAVSAARYGDFAATLRVRTVRQLRRGSAGRPRPWEVGWVVWHYTSPGRFYALTLEPSGWELSKQDPAYPGGERFLASGLSPAFKVGVPHAVGIVQIGNRITVSADGQVLTSFTDTQHPYLSGAIGCYTEDARATFDQIRVAQLPVERH